MVVKSNSFWLEFELYIYVYIYLADSQVQEGVITIYQYNK